MVLIGCTDNKVLQIFFDNESKMVTVYNVLADKIVLVVHIDEWKELTTAKFREMPDGFYFGDSIDV